MKNTIVFMIVLIVGLIFGSIMGKILGQWVPFLGTAEVVTWEPKGDFVIFKYDFFLQVKLNLSGIFGLVLAYWLYKKIK